MNRVDDVRPKQRQGGAHGEQEKSNDKPPTVGEQ
jgi:hypothetical protein